MVTLEPLTFDNIIVAIEAAIATKAKPVSTIQGKGRGLIDMRKGLRSAVRGLWNGALTKSQATGAFVTALAKGIERAWTEGAAECGIQPDEFTQDEIATRDDFITEQENYVDNFINVVAANSKANKGALQPLIQRVELWVNQYESAKSKATADACKNLKLIWVLGPTEKHCRTCPRLAGQIRRASFWKNTVLPRNGPNNRLECKGFYCLCTLEKTDKPMSRGKLPRIP